MRQDGGLSLQPLDQSGARVGAVSEGHVQFVEHNQRDRGLADPAEVGGGVDEDGACASGGHGVGRRWLEAGDGLREILLGDAELILTQVGDGLAGGVGDGDIEQNDLALHLESGGRLRRWGGRRRRRGRRLRRSERCCETEDKAGCESANHAVHATPFGLIFNAITSI